MPPDETFVPNLGQLASAWLESVEFETNHDWTPEEGGVLSFSLDVTRGDVKLDDDGTYTTVGVAIVWVDGQDVDPPFNLRIVVGGHFVWHDQADDDFQVSWTTFNGLYLLFPYVRSYVSTLTALSGGPPLTLPTFAIPRPGQPDETGEFEAVGDQPEA